MEFECRNVNSAFNLLVKVFKEHNNPNYNYTNVPECFVEGPSRCGRIRSINEPVLIKYTHPLERVLLNNARDANPFFHMFEALWMLAGRNDVAPLAYYNSKIKDIASDNGTTFNGAYGNRWRSFEYGEDSSEDQLTVLIKHLIYNPDSRRAVLQMWGYQDLDKIESSKDVCCNTEVMFRIEGGKLNMTVINRSNDLILGLLGSDYVTFSFLQEYMASAIGVDVGVYYHFTNNLHIYLDNWKPDEWLADSTVHPQCEKRCRLGSIYHFDKEVNIFINQHRSDVMVYRSWSNLFIDKVASPMCLAFNSHKRNQYEECYNYIEDIQDEYWKQASIIWIEKRHKTWKLKGIQDEL